MKSGYFDFMDKDVDEAEHSIEMQLPFIQKLMKGNDYTVVPIMVGNINKASEELFGKILAPYLEDKSNFFAISSDFCHWGKRFDYYVIYDSSLPLHQSIEGLDRKGMEIIETQDPDAFTEYLKKYGNTICGRHPIAVFLQVTINFAFTNTV
jgi:AmmeMemoRadiSam system protein B